jgi:DNA-binding protein H-NS
MSLTELIAQKQAIENQIAEVVKTERKEAISTVKTLMVQFSITADELNKNVKPTKKVAPKWKDPVSGKEWTGRGRTPAFVLEAKANGTLESMAV